VTIVRVYEKKSLREKFDVLILRGNRSGIAFAKCQTTAARCARRAATRPMVGRATE
jgi:hypothetical protein